MKMLTVIGIIVLEIQKAKEDILIVTLEIITYTGGWNNYVVCL